MNVQKNILTPKERSVFVFLSKGDTNKEIAIKLNVTEGTIKVHVRNMFKKTCSKNRVELINKVSKERFW
jgi:DNA-binding NarL/FixJ family response regulator